MDAREDSPPPEKGAYELARDENVARIQKIAAPAVAARVEW